MGDVKKGQCGRKGCREAAHRFGLCIRHRREEQERLEAADARIMASIGHQPDDEDELDDDADLEGESFDDELPLKCPTCGGGDCGCDLADDPQPVKPRPPEEPEEVNVNEKRCSRTGCGKTLRANNSKGVCSSGCLSADAPPFARAEGVIDVPVTRKEKPAEAVKQELPKAAYQEPPLISGAEQARELARWQKKPNRAQATLEKFRQLGETLGFDADELLAEFAQSFIDRAKRAVTAPKLALVGEERQLEQLVATTRPAATPPSADPLKADDDSYERAEVGVP
jgi:hypothetical protein